MLGGVMLEGDNVVEFTADDLEKGLVTFYVAALDPSEITRHVDLTAFDVYEELSSNNPGTFEPRFSQSTG